MSASFASFSECAICTQPAATPTECACHSQLAHVACLVRRARERAARTSALHERAEAWSVCPTCHQTFRGHVHRVLSDEWIRVAESAESAASPESAGAARVELTLAKNRRAISLIELGVYPQAASELRALLAESARLHGSEHPVTLITAGNLALAFSRNDDYEAAEQIQRELLCARLRLCGPMHPSVLTVQGNLAATLMRRGKLEESEELERRVHSGRATLLGPESPATLVSAGNLALVMSMQGRKSEAAAVMLATWRVQRRVLGPDHPDTTATRASLKTILSPKKLAS